MTLPLVVFAITGLLVFLSVLIKPNIYVGRVKLGSYWVISLVGALVLLIFGTVPLDYLFESLTSSDAINPIKILILFFSMTALSVFLDEIGFFSYLANFALRKVGKSQIKLFIYLYITVSVLTVFTSNDIVILTFTPFICLFSKNAKINPLPYLFAEFVASNSWSMLFIIGNPTNIYLASSAGIGFIEYFLVMAIPTVMAGAVSILMLLLIFKKSLKSEISATVAPEKIKDKVSLALGIEHLALCTVLLAVSSYLHFEMYLISALFALSLFLFIIAVSLSRKKPLAPLVSTVKRLPYELVPFVLSMFVIVLSLNYCGASEKFASLLFSANPIFTIGLSSFFSSNVINNIPMSVLFSSLVGTQSGSASYLPAVYSAVIGSNLGALFTPVGALAGIMWASILRRFDVKLSFKKFILYGAAISIPALVAALLGLCIVF